LFKTSQKYNGNSRAKALKEITKVEVGGGTEILEPLVDIYTNSKEEESDLERHIFILTDGDVFSVDEMIKTISENSHKWALHCFGFGNDVNTNLVIRSAQAGGGMYYFIHENDTEEQVNAKIINAMCKMFEPKISLGLPVMSVQDPNTIYEHPTLMDCNKLLYHGDYFTYFKIIKDTGSGLSGRLFFKLTQDGMIN
jgi:hypothetical protein